jgi:hypothetical protein
MYDKRSKAFQAASSNIGALSGVKGISNLSSGMVVLTRPDKGKMPLPAEPCTLNAWGTSYVDFYSADGIYRSSGHRKGAAYYKGRLWTPDYQ